MSNGRCLQSRPRFFWVILDSCPHQRLRTVIIVILVLIVVLIKDLHCDHRHHGPHCGPYQRPALWSSSSWSTQRRSRAFHCEKCYGHSSELTTNMRSGSFAAMLSFWLYCTNTLDLIQPNNRPHSYGMQHSTPAINFVAHMWFFKLLFRSNCDPNTSHFTLGVLQHLCSKHFAFLLYWGHAKSAVKTSECQTWVVFTSPTPLYAPVYAAQMPAV